MPDVDSLFPPKPGNDVDTLFPASIERDRNAPPSSPVQDFLFSSEGPVGTRLHSAGRVLSALGQGAQHGWGTEPLGISKESEDHLKRLGVFNDYMNGTSSIIRAANETLLRPAAVVAQGAWRGLGAVMGAGQAAVAEVGAIEGYPLLGRDLAAMIEAMPAGAKQITGIPHSVHGRPAEAPVERPVEAPISGEVKPEAKPVDAAVETPAPVVEAAPVEAAPVAKDASTAAIAEDVTAKLVAAGRPEVEARASAELIASHYEARAERFKGERGTAEELYKADGADIRPGDGAAPAKSEPIKPNEGGPGATIDTVPDLKKALRGRAGADPQTWSLYEHLASEGGLKPTADLQKIFDGKNPFIPGFGNLLRKDGLSMEEALTRAKEGRYVFDPNDLAHLGHDATRPAAGELTKTVNDLHDMIAEESRGRKNYRNDHTPQAKIDPEVRAKDILDELHSEIEAHGGKVVDDPAIERRVVEIMTKEGETDVHSAYERAIMESHDANEADLNARRATKETAQVRGHDAPDSGAAPDSLKEFVDDSGYTWASEEEASRAASAAPSEHGAHDPAAAELELSQHGLDLGKELNQAAYHGSPYDFDVFDTGKIGTGEGAQAYGHGLYFAEREGVAKSYRDALAVDPRDKITEMVQGWLGARRPNEHVSRDAVQKMLERHHMAAFNELAKNKGAVDDLVTYMNGHSDNMKTVTPAALAALRRLDKILPTPGGYLYRVDIKPEPHQFLQWDKPLSGQSLKIQDAVHEALIRSGVSKTEANYIINNKTGEDAYRRLAKQTFAIKAEGSDAFGPSKAKTFEEAVAEAGGDKMRVRRIITTDPVEGSKMLKEMGIPGIRYLDQGSRPLRNVTDLETRLAKAEAELAQWSKLTTDRIQPTMLKSINDEIADLKGQLADAKATPQTHNYVVFDPKNIEITDKNGKPVSQQEFELNQIKRGKINLRKDAKPVITLFKDANASTFIHETGHQWLEELMKDSEHPLAPAELKADAIKVLDWLGVDNAESIKTSHHEKFARGFERYMMEGKAPNQALASVFEKFRNWLTKIYQTVTRLKSPINDEIRGVFDRLLTMRPSEVKLDGPPKTFADIHEADAAHTSPESAHPVAETIQAERDMLANEHIPEGHDARLENIAAKADRRQAGGPQPVRDGDEARLGAEQARNDQAPGAVGEGGSNAAPESARPSITGGKSQAPAGPLEPFEGPASPFVDKAGNIRLDNLGTAEDVNKAIRDAAAENDDFMAARRGVVSDGQVLDLADALGMDAEKLAARNIGQAFNAEQIVAARKLLIQSATSVRDAMIKAAHGSEADVMAYAESKARHQLIQEQVSGITAEAGRALRAFRSLEGGAEAKQLGEFLKDATGKTLFQLQREAQLGMSLETPQQVSKFVNDLVKPTWKDMVIEAWISALLSGAKTHAANIIGNSLVALARPVETAIAGGVGSVRRAVTGSTEGVRATEAMAEVYGIVQGAREGVVAGWKAFKTEEPQFTSAKQTEQHYQKALPSFTVNIAGKEMELGGRQARIPLRLLTAEDEVFKAIAFRGNINRQAFAQAIKEGLEGDAFSARVEHLSANPSEAMVEAAKVVANYQTFQTPLGPTGRAIQNFANSHIAAKFVMPFVRTPLNLLKYAQERTPLGLFAQETRANLSGKNGAAAQDTQVARIAIGTMIGAATYSLALDGLITGGGPADPKQRAVMIADGWQPYSVKIGDMYYAYNRLDPFSIVMGLIADAHEIGKAGRADDLEKQHIPAMIFAAISKNITDRTSLRGPSDLMQALTQPERFGKGYIKGLVGTLIPAFLAQTAQTLDPIQREARTILDGLKARTPGMSKDLFPKRDIWGEPVVREGGLGPDIASPIMERRVKDDPVNKALLSAGLYPSKISRKIEGIELTDQQYDDYQRVAGRTAKMMLNQIVKIPGFDTMPKNVRSDLMQNAVTAARAQARALTVMESISGENNIVTKSIELQKKKRLSPAQ